MCIICYLPAGTSLSEEEWTNCVQSNPDGSGYMFVDDFGQIKIRRNMDGHDLYDRFLYDQNKNPNAKFVVHHRIGTHGEKSDKNLHPFRVNKNMAMCHNGILDWYVPKSAEESDTLDFTNKVLRHLPHNFLRNTGMYNMIDEILGVGKMVFLDARDESVTIMNEYLGKWDNNRWFSNDSFKRSFTTYTGYVYDFSDHWGMRPTPLLKANDNDDKVEQCNYCETFCTGSMMLNTRNDSVCYHCAKEVIELMDDDVDDAVSEYLLNKYADLTSETMEDIIDELIQEFNHEYDFISV